MRFRRRNPGPLSKVRRLGRLPVVNFAAGGVATPADAALCMQLGVDGVRFGAWHAVVRNFHTRVASRDAMSSLQCTH